MLTILLHSSKTMRPPAREAHDYQEPALLTAAVELAEYLKTLDVGHIEKSMQLSPTKAQQTHTLLQNWNTDAQTQRAAIDAFLGDIYSGLQVHTFSQDDRTYANEHLLILSGLYGGLRALDSIYPYRLEMGYRLPDERYKNLYSFWSGAIAELIPHANDIVNLSAVEYTKSVLPYRKESTVITPKFLTVSPTTGEPTFVTVHAKVARGAFARWLIVNRIDSLDDISKFNDIGYAYDSSLSSDTEPVFVCKQFGGIGLSVRLT